MPKISIITPVYNAGKFLEDCFNHIDRQTLKDLEIVMVDDGSTDNSVEIIRNRQQNDKRIVLLQQEHQGSGPARNYALSKATGEYVAFLDADDFYVDDDALERMYEASKSKGAYLCASYRKRLSKGEMTDHAIFRDLPVPEDDGSWVDFRDLQEDYQYQSYIFSLDFLRKNDISFPPYLRFQDPPFLLKAMVAAKRFLFVPVTLYCYRWGHQQKTFSGDKLQHALLGIKNNLCVAAEHNYDVLYEKLIGRLNEEAYYRSISDDLSKEVCDILLSIEDLNKKSGHNLFIRVMDKVHKIIESINEPTGSYAGSLPEGMVAVSVILPSLNVGEYIRQCLESVVSQTLKEIEIICVDAGSTDGTLEVIQEYAAKDPRIQVIISDKKSYGHQMNLAMDRAKGKYIGIVETDDYVPAEMYEELYEIAEANEVDFVKADFYRFTGEGARVQKDLNRITRSKKGYYNRIIDISKERECFNFIMNTWSGIYNREFLNKHHIRHNDTPGASYQDNGFWFQTFAYAKRAYFVNKPYYMNRRDNPDSSVFNSDKVFIMCEEYERLLETLKKNPEIFESFKCEYAYFAFRNYRWTLDRILMKDKPRFFEKIKSFCKEMREQNMLDYNVFARYDEMQAFDLHAIESEPEIFYERMYTLKQEIMKGLEDRRFIIIYGAGGVGQLCCDSLMNEGLGNKLAGFAVSGSDTGMQKGLPVRNINDWMDYKVQGTVIVAVSPKYKSEINAELLKRGFQDIVFWPDSTYIRGEEFSLNAGNFNKDLTRGWVFPYAKVKKGSRVVLYGAYEVGQSYYNQLQVTGYADVVKWVDDDELWLHKSLGVESLESLRETDFDYAVVAWSNRRHFKKALWNILSLGVPYNRIVWKDEGEKLLDDVYKNSLLEPAKVEVKRQVERQLKVLEERKKQIEAMSLQNQEEAGFILPELTVKLDDAAENIKRHLDNLLQNVGQCLVLELAAEDAFAYEGLTELLDYACTNNAIMHVRVVTKGRHAPNHALSSVLRNNFVEVHVYQESGNCNTELTGKLKHYGIDCQDVFPEVCLEKKAGIEEKARLILNKNGLSSCRAEEPWKEKKANGEFSMDVGALMKGLTHNS